MCVIFREKKNKRLTYTYLMRIIEPSRGGVVMKRREFIKRLEAAGFRFKRHGASHDIYERGNEQEQVPRHGDINENLAKAILKRRGA